MAPNGSRRSLAPSERGVFASINPTHLAIACTRYPYLLDPRNLTPAHIAAILNHTGLFTPSFPPSPTPATHITARTVLSQTNNLMRRAFAFGEYYNSLTLLQRFQMGSSEHFLALGWQTSEGMTLEEFAECVRSWNYIQVLDNDGEEAVKRVLEFGWRAYDRVPEAEKVRVGLQKVGGEGSGEST